MGRLDKFQTWFYYSSTKCDDTLILPNYYNVHMQGVDKLILFHSV